MKKPTITLSKIEQEIDLEELFGVDLTEDESLKQAIGQVLIDRMVARAEDGKGIDGVKLKAPYSDRYLGTVEFKAAGKSKSRVNMKLTGDMLASIDLISISGNKVTIGIEDGNQVAKAYNHQVGDTVPARPFFGFTADELKDIRSRFAGKIKRASKDGETAKDRLALDIIESVRGK